METAVIAPQCDEQPIPSLEHYKGARKVTDHIEERRGVYFFIVRHTCPPEGFITNHLNVSGVTGNGTFWPPRIDVSGVYIDYQNTTQEAVDTARSAIHHLGFEIIEEYQLMHS